MAAGVKDVVDEVVLHSSLVCLMITSLGEHSLHPSLIEAQGSHLIQGFVHIQPPDMVSARSPTHTHLHSDRELKLTAAIHLQDQRVTILHKLILKKSSQSEDTSLDLAAVAKQTEGYTAQDLALLLERAVHASVMRSGHGDGGAGNFSWNFLTSCFFFSD